MRTGAVNSLGEGRSDLANDVVLTREGRLSRPRNEIRIRRLRSISHDDSPGVAYLANVQHREAEAPVAPHGAEH